MARTSSCLLLAALAVMAAAAVGASARCHSGQHRGRGGVLRGNVPARLKPDVTVAKPGGRGGGDVTTIADALERYSVSPKASGYFVIYIREGVYEEHVVVTNKNVVLMGDGRDKTIITGRRSNKTRHNVMESATLTAREEGFMARDLCIRNTAGGADDGQAVALLSDSDHSVLYRCDIQGYQDTVFANTNRQFYRECRIWGTVDFIFGNAAAVFQKCELNARRPADPRKHDVITAQGREEHGGRTGFVFQECTVAPSALPGEGLTAGLQTYLGPGATMETPRPGGVFLRCSIDPIVHADGLVSWSNDRQTGGKEPPRGHTNHIKFAEYDNHLLLRSGSATKVSVHWKNFTAISREDAEEFTPHSFIGGDEWIPQTGVPYKCGL